MIEVDAKDVLTLFAKLSPKKQKQVYRNVMKKGAVILQNETKSQLKRTGIKGVSRRPKKANWKPMISGIKYRVRKNGEEAKVHIMGEFRLKFFEMGTNIRLTKKGISRGRIKQAYKFFAKSKEAKEREIFDGMNKLLSQSIQKVAKK